MMDESWEDIVGERSPKDLLKLIMRKGALKMSDASDVLEIKRSTLEEWVKVLTDKRYITTEGDGIDPLMKPAPDLIMRIDSHRSGATAAAATLKETATIGMELGKEKSLREQLEASLADKEHILDSMKAELLQEKKARAELEEKLKSVEVRNPKDMGADMLDMLLQRERSERMKLEELLKKKQAELDELLSGRPRERLPASNPKPPQKTEHAIAPQPTMPKTPSAYERPVVLENAPEAKKPDTPAPSPAAAAEKKSEEVGKVEVAAKAEPPQPVQKASTPSSPSPSRLVLNVDKPGATFTHTARTGKDVDTEDLLELLKKKSSFNIRALEKEFGIDEKKVDQMIKELASYEAVEIVKRFFGTPDVVLKKDMDLEVVRQKIEARKVKEEMQRMRGGK